MRLFTEIGIIFVRQIRPTLRNPVVLIFGFMQPVLYLALFGPLLQGLAGPGSSSGGSWQWFVPGMLVLLGLFGTAFAGFSLMPELRGGSMDRLLATPMSRVALLLGRVLRDIAVLVVQAVLFIVVAIPFGFTLSPGGALLGLLLLVVMGVGLATVSYALATILRHEYVFSPVLQATIMPLMLLSGVLLPMSMAPDWLYAVSRVNPLSYVVDAERALFSGDIAQSSVLAGTVVALVVAAISVAWGTRVIRRQSA